jgi:hypothetical protein
MVVGRVHFPSLFRLDLGLGFLSAFLSPRQRLDNINALPNLHTLPPHRLSSCLLNQKVLELLDPGTYGGAIRGRMKVLGCIFPQGQGADDDTVGYEAEGAAVSGIYRE